VAKPIINCVDDILLKYSIHEDELTKLISGERFVKAFTQHGGPIVLKLSKIEGTKIDGYILNFNKLKNLTHKNIVKHIDIYRLGNFQHPYSIMEVLEYANAGSILSHLKKFEYEEVIEIFKQVFTGFIFLHKNGILHRDIKLNNILISIIRNKKIVKIADIELWPSDDRGILRTTPEFLAPEVLNYNLYTIQSEIWAIGAMLYEMFTGKFPFGSRKQGISAEQIRLISKNEEVTGLSDIPIPFQQIITNSLRRDLAIRVHSVSELRNMLNPATILYYRLQAVFK